jgi:excisionase family DNA binding protein
MTSDLYIDTTEAAKILGVSRKKVRALARAGELIGHKAGAENGMKGREWRLTRGGVSAYLVKHFEWKGDTSLYDVSLADIATLQSPPDSMTIDEYKRLQDGLAIRGGLVRGLANDEPAADSIQVGGDTGIPVTGKLTCAGPGLVYNCHTVDELNRALNPDFAAIAARLLTFEGVDEHMVWPLVKYRIEFTDESGLIGAVGYACSGSGVVFSGDYGSRNIAIAACRADLALRLSAVRELEQGGVP